MSDSIDLDFASQRVSFSFIQVNSEIESNFLIPSPTLDRLQPNWMSRGATNECKLGMRRKLRFGARIPVFGSCFRSQHVTRASAKPARHSSLPDSEGATGSSLLTAPSFTSSPRREHTSSAPQRRPDQLGPILDFCTEILSLATDRGKSSICYLEASGSCDVSQKTR